MAGYLMLCDGRQAATWPGSVVKEGHLHSRLVLTEGLAAVTVRLAALVMVREKECGCRQAARMRVVEW